MNPRVIFKWDYKRDAYNHWATANEKNFWGHKIEKCFITKISPQIKNKPWESVKPFFYTYFKTLYKEKQVKAILKSFSECWKLIEKDYFIKLKKLTNKPICSNRFIAYLTTCLRCPYNVRDNSFMVSIHGSLPQAVLTCAHEILHLQFYRYYLNKCRNKLSKKKLQTLQEAITFILNEKFSDLLIIEDKGYPNHKKLRIKLSKIWKKTKNFDKFLNESIKYLNTSFSKDDL